MDKTRFPTFGGAVDPIGTEGTQYGEGGCRDEFFSIIINVIYLLLQHGFKGGGVVLAELCFASEDKFRLQ